MLQKDLTMTKIRSAILPAIILNIIFSGMVHAGDGKMVILNSVEPGSVKQGEYTGEASAFVSKLKSAEDADLRIYGDKSLQTVLVESCVRAGGLKTGIYLIENRRDLRYFPQYDAKFNEWVCNGECDSDSNCYYAGLKDRKSGCLRGLIYFYYINLSEGYYNLKLLKDRIKVLDSGKYDYPS